MSSPIERAGNCAICGKKTTWRIIAPQDSTYKREAVAMCALCGHYRVDLTQLVEFNKAVQYQIQEWVARTVGKKNHLLSALTKRSFELEQRELMLDEKMMIEGTDSLGRLKVPERARLLLDYIYRQSDFPGHNIPINISTDYPIAVCRNEDEMYFYLTWLAERGLTTHDEVTSEGHWTGGLTMDGWEQVEADRDQGARTSQAFVAMWFDDSMDDLYKSGILPGVENAGYVPLNVKTTKHNDQIDDHIIAEIRRSRFMVADFTGRRTAVYYEAGFARGLGIPVVSTCLKDELNKNLLSFDTRQYKHIPWTRSGSGYGTLSDELRDHIVATIGEGPEKSRRRSEPPL